MLTHDQMHKLERRIAGVLERGFTRTPQPDGKGFDKADAVQAAHDIAEMLTTEYALEDRDALLEEMGVARDLAESVKNLRRLLSELPEPIPFKSPVVDLASIFRGPIPAVQTAGMGGGLGEDVR